LSTNPDAQVIGPKRWFGHNGYTAKNNTQDITPSHWKRI